MLPWLEGGSTFRAYFQPYSQWIDENQELSLILAIGLPLLYFILRSALHERARRRELEADAMRGQQPQRLPNETLERNRREEARYRKSHQSKSPTSRRGGNGPRFK